MIVDASVAVKWLMQEEGTTDALALLGRVDLTAPTLIHAEVANAICKRRRRGEFSDDAELGTLPGRLAALVQTIDETPVMRRALEMAIEVDHPVYDCVYLALAELSGDVVVTADERLLRKLEKSTLNQLALNLSAPEHERSSLPPD